MGENPPYGAAITYWLKEGLKSKRQMRQDAVKQAESFRTRVGDVGFLGATLESALPVGATEFFPVNFQGFYFLVVDIRA